MGFRKVKKQILECLQSGNILHESRGDIDVKNLLLIEELSIDELISIVARARGNEYECSPHHVSADIDVHILKTVYDNKSWYIKWYFVEPSCIFISVHN